MWDLADQPARLRIFENKLVRRPDLAMSDPLRLSRALGDPLSCDYALSILECAYRRQSGRGRLHGLVREVSGCRHHCRCNGVAIGSVTCEVPGDHLPRMWPTLHRHAGSKCDYVEP